MAPWKVSSPDPFRVDELAAALDVGRVVAACLVNRGITSADAAKAFLEPRLADLAPPVGLPDLDRAAERLASAVIRKERVGVFGDYDVDGISSAALVATFLGDLGVRVEVALADRFLGYGLTVEAVDRFAAGECSLLVAVDCGTSDLEAARRAASCGMDLVVIDHHRIEGAHPPVFAFVNPERADSHFPDRTLAAVGLAFYVVAAARTVLSDKGHMRRGDVDPRSFLDLVALGTVADVMPLRGNNRVLVLHGLRQISRKPREGVKALIRAARIRTSNLRADHIAFQLAPRLNAAGRLGGAEAAFALLTARDRATAEPLAARLDQLSAKRRALEEEVVQAALRQLDDRRLAADRVVVVAGDGWHRGVLGIVASRLTEQTGKPAFVIGFEGDVGTGSARGQGQINLHESLTHAATHLIRFGGHRDAAGFTVERGSLFGFEEALRRFADERWIEAKDEAVVCDARLSVSELSGALLEDLGRLGPFGLGNAEPVFEVDGLYLLEKRIVGRDHLKLELKTPTGSISAFGPRMGEAYGSIPPLVRVAASLTFDEWRGDGTPELRLTVPPLPGT